LVSTIVLSASLGERIINSPRSKIKKGFIFQNEGKITKDIRRERKFQKQTESRPRRASEFIKSSMYLIP
jgi:hypothetical protein